MDDSARGVAADAAGNLYVTGCFRDTVDFGAGPLTSAGEGDVFLLKLDPAGNTLWSKRFGIISHECGVNIAIDPAGNILLSGNYYSSPWTSPPAIDLGGGPLPEDDFLGGVFLTKLDAQGNHVWSQGFLGWLGSLSARGLALDSTGAPVLDYQWANGFGGERYVRKLDPAGNPLWNFKMYAGLSSEGGSAVDGAGNVILAYGLLESLDGATCSPCDQDVVIKKLAPAGTLLWQTVLDGPIWGDGGTVRAVAADAAGNIVMTGYHLSGLDFGGGALPNNTGFTVKLDPAGAHVWSVPSVSGFHVALDAAGNVALANSYCNGNPPALCLERLGPGGASIWSQTLAETVIQGLAIDPSSRSVVVGSFSGTIDLGSGPLTSAGGQDAFLAAFLP